MYRQQYNIQIPLLGQKTKQQIVNDIYKAIVDEATAIDFYAKLLKEAPDDLNREFIEHAHEDEQDHLDLFTRLYYFYTGQHPRYNINQVQYASYKDGILIALKNELEAVEFYRDVQASDKSQLTRDVFYYAMVDELEHATRFSTLLNRL